MVIVRGDLDGLAGCERERRVRVFEEPGPDLRPLCVEHDRAHDARVLHGLPQRVQRSLQGVKGNMSCIDL